MSDRASPSPPASPRPACDEQGAAAADAAPASTGGLLASIAEEIGELSEFGGSLADAFERPAEEDADEFEHDDYDRLDLQLEGILELSQLRASLRQSLREEVQAALSRYLSPQRVLLRDKLTMVLGTLSMVGSAYWLGSSPQTFYRLYTVQGVLLMLLRWTHYRWFRQHYYLLDFCYWANALLMLHVYAWPTSVLLAKITFAYSTGPLLWSILAFRNSLVYHSLDKMTSHFMHFWPACVCWASRWHTGGPLAERLAAVPAARARWESAGIWDLALLPLLPYCVWAALYYLKVFIISSAKIQQRNYETLYKFVTTGRNRKGMFGAIVLRAPPRLQPLVYMSVHLLLTLISLLLVTLWWHSYWACTTFLAAIFTASVWSGANFYFSVFASRYLSGLGIPPGQRAASTPSASQQPSASVTQSDAKKRS